MKNKFLAALAVLGVVIGSLTLVPAANAVYSPNGYGGQTWHDDPQG